MASSSLRWVAANPLPAIAYARASASILSAAIPVTSAARSGACSSRSACTRNASAPTVQSRRYSVSSNPSRKITCIRLNASIPSVPGRITRCSSASAAVRVLYGSITTNRAPFRRASSINGHRCTLFPCTFAPQQITSPACAKSCGHRPQLHPIDTLQRRPARTRTDCSIKLRRPHPIEKPPVHRPIPQLPNRPRVAIRQHTLRPKLRCNPLQLPRHQRKRLVPRDPLERLRLAPLRQRPLRHPARRFIGYSNLSGEYTRSR